MISGGKGTVVATSDYMEMNVLVALKCTSHFKNSE